MLNPAPKQLQQPAFPHLEPSRTTLAMPMLCCAAPCAVQASRVASLQQLNQALYSPTTQVDALQHLSTVWPRLVGLLWDAQHAVCAAAAGPVGSLGALAAQAAAAQQAQRGITSSAGGHAGGGLVWQVTL